MCSMHPSLPIPIKFIFLAFRCWLRQQSYFSAAALVDDAGLLGYRDDYLVVQ